MFWPFAVNLYLTAARISEAGRWERKISFRYAFAISQNKKQIHYSRPLRIHSSDLEKRLSGIFHARVFSVCAEKRRSYHVCRLKRKTKRNLSLSLLSWMCFGVGFWFIVHLRRTQNLENYLHSYAHTVFVCSFNLFSYRWVRNESNNSSLAIILRYCANALLSHLVF